MHVCGARTHSHTLASTRTAHAGLRKGGGYPSTRCSANRWSRAHTHMHAHAHAPTHALACPLQVRARAEALGFAQALGLDALLRQPVDHSSGAAAAAEAQAALLSSLPAVQVRAVCVPPSAAIACGRRLFVGPT
jgi:hypothetical protein